MKTYDTSMLVSTKLQVLWKATLYNNFLNNDKGAKALYICIQVQPFTQELRRKYRLII